MQIVICKSNGLFVRVNAGCIRSIAAENCSGKNSWMESRMIDGIKMVVRLSVLSCLLKSVSTRPFCATPRCTLIYVNLCQSMQRCVQIVYLFKFSVLGVTVKCGNLR